MLLPGRWLPGWKTASAGPADVPNIKALTRLSFETAMPAPNGSNPSPLRRFAIIRRTARLRLAVFGPVPSSHSEYIHSFNPALAANSAQPVSPSLSDE